MLAAGTSFDLGNVYAGGVGGAENLSFTYRDTGTQIVLSQIILGAVEYLVLGDMDGDGNVDSDDVPLIIQALVDRATYDANGFTGTTGFLIDADINGDIDGSGTFDLGDLAAYSALLGGLASASAVPEPTSVMLLLVAAVLISTPGRRQRQR